MCLCNAANGEDADSCVVAVGGVTVVEVVVWPVEDVVLK